MKSLIALLALAALSVLASPGGAKAQATGGCTALPRETFALVRDAPSRATAAAVRPVDARSPGLCVVDGYTNPNVGWRLFLPDPAQWNGKMTQDGCGGRCGDRKDETCEMTARRGYACIAANLGVAGGFQDPIWAIDNLQGEVDVGFRAMHVTNLIARAVIARYYGRPPAHAYYLGISNAGRQGLIEAQRFPEDFDGIVAGEPAMRGAALKDLPSTMEWAAGVLAPGGKGVFTAEEIAVLHAAVLARCDLDDKLKDGIVSDPRACKFDPGQIACAAGRSGDCLKPAQVAAARTLYAGQVEGRGLIGLRLMRGSEPRWVGPFVSKDGGPGRYAPRRDDDAAAPYGFVFNDGSNPDLRAFQARGGKLILFQGWVDEITLPEGAVDYYQSVERLMGGPEQTRGFARLFTVPGQGHTPGGPGAEAVDYLGAIDDWVAKGVAPDVLKGHHLKDGERFFGANIPLEDLKPDNVAFTRPIYPYPTRARYSGKGDPNDWKSWGPAR